MPVTLTPTSHQPLTPTAPPSWWVTWDTPILTPTGPHRLPPGTTYAHGLLTLTTDTPDGSHLAHLHLTYADIIGSPTSALRASLVTAELSPPHPGILPLPQLSHLTCRQIPGLIAWDPAYLLGHYVPSPFALISCSATPPHTIRHCL